MHVRAADVDCCRSVAIVEEEVRRNPRQSRSHERLGDPQPPRSLSRAAGEEKLLSLRVVDENPDSRKNAVSVLDDAFDIVLTQQCERTGHATSIVIPAAASCDATYSAMVARRQMLRVRASNLL